VNNTIYDNFHKDNPIHFQVKIVPAPGGTGSQGAVEVLMHTVFSKVGEYSVHYFIP
jgi:hypothetical protein